MICVVPDPVYGQRYIVAVGESAAAILAKLRAEGADVTDELRQKLVLSGYGRSVFNLDACIHVLWLKRLDIRQPNDVAVLAHEATHIAVSIFSRMHQPVDPSTDEPFAYYVQFIVREVLRKARS